MADEAPTTQTLEQAIAENRATNPRLDAPAPAPAPEPEPQPEPVADAATEGDPDPTPEPAPAPKPKRTAEEVLKGRVGHLTKTLGAKDAAIAAAERRAEAAEALLTAQGRAATPEGEPAPAPTPASASVNPATGRTYTQAEFDTAVSARAEADAFNRQADAMYDAGAGKFDDWKESVEMLNATGIMNKTLLDAAMATDAGADVIHHLGNDVEEAQRIAALPPIRMAAELTKLATKLSTPPRVPISAASAPIPNVRGAVNPVIDIDRAAQGGNDISAYREARAKQGAWYAQPKGQRNSRT